jgi:hypothetical protein
MLTAATASVLVLVCGVIHGYWTDRWHPPADLAAASDQMEKLPLDIGEWKGEALEVKSPHAGGVAGCIQRRYVNRRGDAAILMLVCGRPGPVGTHSPDVCYGASGFNVGPRSRATASDHGEFWTADAERTETTDQTRLRLYWGWSAGAGWTAPDDARGTYLRSPVLHKLYVIRDLNGPTPASQEEPCVSFLHALLPELDRTLFSPGS